MLHQFFNEQSHNTSEEISETYEVLERYADKLSNVITTVNQSSELTKFEVWTNGLSASLKELVASHYAAQKCREHIHTSILQDMSPEEKLNYDRYVYFDKNAFIRVFSLLDKLGTFLNELLYLETEKIKPYFSYFTVLRNMRENEKHVPLMKPLNQLKEESKEAVNRLRKRRNTEIHYMNSEMQDDLIQNIRMYGQKVQVENLNQQIDDLTVALKMVNGSIKISVLYAEKLLRSK